MGKGRFESKARGGRERVWGRQGCWYCTTKVGDWSTGHAGCEVGGQGRERNLTLTEPVFSSLNA